MEKRRGQHSFNSLIKTRQMKGGYAVNDSTAMHFINETLHHVVCSTADGGYELVTHE